MIEHSFAPFGPFEASYLSAKLGIDFMATNFDSPRWLCVSGRDNGRLLGLCAFEFPTWFNADFHIAVDDSRCITRRIMRAMFTAVFSKAVRVSAEIDPANAHALQLAARMGFEPEGYRRLAIEGVRDAVLLGMTRDTCRALRASVRARQRHENEVSDGRLAENS